MKQSDKALFSEEGDGVFVFEVENKKGKEYWFKSTVMGKVGNKLFQNDFGSEIYMKIRNIFEVEQGIK